MIILIFLLPIMALLSMYAFHCANWTTKNYEGKYIPYSLGVLVVFSYVLLCAFPPTDAKMFSYVAMCYVIGIWFIGYLDDRFGQPYPKGIKGHFSAFFKEGKITTGMIKVIGTLLLAAMFVYFNLPKTILDSIRFFLILTLMPHVANLFDTRPLRVWKVTFVFSLTLVPFVAIPFVTLIYLAVVFYLLFILEGHRKAMLGDNGSTAIGAVLAVITIMHTQPLFQWSMVYVAFTLMLIAERISFSALIEKQSFLRWFDQIGIPTRK